MQPDKAGTAPAFRRVHPCGAPAETRLRKRRPLTTAPSPSRLDELNAIVNELPLRAITNNLPAIIEAFSEDMQPIVGALPAGIPQERLALFRKVFREWWDFDLSLNRWHFSAESRAADRLRAEKLDLVSRKAQELCDALATLDDQGLAQVGFWAVTRSDYEGKVRTPREAEEWLTAVTSQEPRAAVEWLARFVERRPGLSVKWPDRAVVWLAGLAAIGGSLGLAKMPSGWGLSKRGQPRNLISSAVIFDLAALFEWVTGTDATMRVHNQDHGDYKKPYGPFWDFAQVVWPLVFGSHAGLSAAVTNWAAAQRKFKGRSRVIENIASRRPGWGLLDKKSGNPPILQNSTDTVPPE